MSRKGSRRVTPTALRRVLSSVALSVALVTGLVLAGLVSEGVAASSNGRERGGGGHRLPRHVGGSRGRGLPRPPVPRRRPVPDAQPAGRRARARRRRPAALPLDHRAERLRGPAHPGPGPDPGCRPGRRPGRAERRTPPRRPPRCLRRAAGQAPPARRRGVVIGFVDSGLGPDSPLFAAVPRLGRQPRRFHGACATGEDWTTDTCDRKVVGARWFVAGFGPDDVRSSSSLSPRDDDGHGTQMASIAAGNAGSPSTSPGSGSAATAGWPRRRGSPSTRRAGPRPTRPTTAARPPTS